MIRLHLIANAVLLWLAYYWLGVGESTIPKLLWSALLAVLIVAAAVLLHAAALSSESGVRAALSRSGRKAAPLLLVALAALIVYGFLSWWHSQSGTPAFTLASWLTLKLRKPVRPESVLRVFTAILWIIRWAILPCLLIPLATRIVNGAWPRPGKLFWPAVPLLLTAALWVPLKLLGWTPQLESFSMEMASFIGRAAVAYGLFVASFLLLWKLARPPLTPAESPRIPDEIPPVSS